ncbi:hypothetical protein PUN28_003852 [Cardiocondyla obscurior]|uniref:Uncharacterized protein n=1 Tax=Cardiocondyla obscurior TaxID=286306 RepID=A0AAW2GMZ6_9HYME
MHSHIHPFIYLPCVFHAALLKTRADRWSPEDVCARGITVIKSREKVFYDAGPITRPLPLRLSYEPFTRSLLHRAHRSSDRPRMPVA